MTRVLSLTDPSKLSIFSDRAEAIQFARTQGHVISFERDVIYSDFPRKNPTAHPLEIPTIPLTFLLSRKGY